LVSISSMLNARILSTNVLLINNNNLIKCLNKKDFCTKNSRVQH